MWISSAFDGGNIELAEEGGGSAADRVRLRIRPDRESEHFQWFYFRLAGAKGRSCTLTIENAGEASYPKGFEDYSAVASYDRQAWFRIPTRFDGQRLVIEHAPEADVIYFAYFVPYSMERHHDLVARCVAHAHVGYEVLGKTSDGQDIELLRIGEPSPGRLPIWAIARQHPAETMSEWWMEGFLERLLDPFDPVPRYLLERCIFYLVPNMNPDGTRRGHLRTNALGVNLNREWQSPSEERSPEVFHVRRRILETNCSIMIDVHGEEVLPYNFISGFEGIPDERPEQRRLLDLYRERLAALNPDFQIEHGYAPTPPGQADLRICTNYMAECFGSISMTLEMPFKDTADSPEPQEGWSPARSRALGRSCLNALRPLIDHLL